MGNMQVGQREVKQDAPVVGALTREEWEQIRAKVIPSLQDYEISGTRWAIDNVLKRRPVTGFTLEQVWEAILAETTDPMTPPFYDLASRVCKRLAPKPETAEQILAEKIVKQLTCIDLTDESYKAAAIQDITCMIAALEKEAARG